MHAEGKQEKRPERSDGGHARVRVFRGRTFNGERLVTILAAFELQVAGVIAIVVGY